MVNNLTEGKPLKLLFLFTMPMVVDSLFQQLYNMVDSMVVGRLVEEDALAAVGSSFSVILLSVAIAAELSMGCTVVISQSFGAGKILEMKITVSTALVSLEVIGLIIMEIGEIIAEPPLILLETDPDIIADSLAYLRIYFRGAIFPSLYNSLNGIYNTLEGSQAPLKFLMVPVLTNIVLDLLFVTQFNVGVTGMTWATLTTQGTYTVFPFFVLITRLRKMENEETAKGKSFTFFDMFSTKHITKADVPSMLQQPITPISMMLMQGFVNSYRKVFVAGYTAATKIDTLATMPNMNFSNTTSGYAA